jgi:2-haloacid dehalogenase
VDALRSAGLRLGLLSNFTPRMLESALRTSGLRDAFPYVLSTHAARTYKPDPAAYALGTEALGLPRDAVVFTAFAGWDAAGARRFGYPTFWANRAHASPEELGVTPDAAGAGLDGLVAFVVGDR